MIKLEAEEQLTSLSRYNFKEVKTNKIYGKLLKSWFYLISH